MIQTINVYAIRHKPTGHYLPGSGRQGAIKPCDVEPADPTEEKPRLWNSSRQAHSALTHWLKGRFRTYHDEDGPYTVPVPMAAPRRREDMEVVPLELILR